MDGAATQGGDRRFRVAASLLIVLLAAAVCAGAFASWSPASRALPTSMFSSGSLSLREGSVALDARRLTPGQTVTGSMVVANEGNASGRFTLRTSSLVDGPGPAGGSLAHTVWLTVTDVTVVGAPRRLYTGSLAGLSGVDVGRFGPGAARTFRIAVTFPQQAVGGSAFSGSSLSLAFAWTAVSTI
jgi:hypothetical protein